MNSSRTNLRQIWRRLAWPDVGAMALVSLGLSAWLVGLSGGLYSFTKILGVLSGGYLGDRGLAWGRSRLLWSLRNRLIVAGLFLSVVPVVVLVTLAALSG